MYQNGITTNRCRGSCKGTSIFCPFTRIITSNQSMESMVIPTISHLSLHAMRVASQNLSCKISDDSSEAKVGFIFFRGECTSQVSSSSSCGKKGSHALKTAAMFFCRNGPEFCSLRWNKKTEQCFQMVKALLIFYIISNRRPFDLSHFCLNVTTRLPKRPNLLQNGSRYCTNGSCLVGCQLKGCNNLHTPGPLPGCH